MQSKQLGNSGLTVSEVGFGGIPITRLQPEESVELVRHGLSLGFTFFDTANLYGDSEAKMGLALETVRDQVVLATKTRARDAATAAKHLKQSLEMLRTDWIDLYQLHNISESDALENIFAPGGVWEVVQRARDEGSIRAVGFSSHNPDMAVKACRTGKFSTVQFAFNFVEHDSLERVFDAAREQGMGMLGMKPLGGGLLGRADLCFGFLQEHPEVIPIPGIQAKGEAEEIAALYEQRRRLSGEDWRAIEAIRLELGERFCHRCEYCLPCEQGVAIPRVMLFKSQRRRFPPEMVKKLGSEPMATVEACTECGECVEKCPYDLPIPEMIREYYGQYQDFLSELD
jgi:uncharacterized protein